MFEVERKKALEGIKKCDNFLKDWNIKGFKTHYENHKQANEIPPQEVAATFKRFNREIYRGGGEPDADFNLVIFYANAKYGFILRLVKMQECENALSLA